MDEHYTIWKEFDESESDKNHCEKMNLLNKLSHIAPEEKKNQIELETNLVYLIFTQRWKLSHLEDVRMDEIISQT